MEKSIEIGGRAVPFRASAAVPRLYRVRFGRDIIADMNRLKKSFDKAVNASIPADTPAEQREQLLCEAQLSAMDLTLFENMAYIMARHAAPSPAEFPGTPDEWLEAFEMFDIYEILPQLLELWGQNMATTAVPKNVPGRQRDR